MLSFSCILQEFRRVIKTYRVFPIDYNFNYEIWQEVRITVKIKKNRSNANQLYREGPLPISIYALGSLTYFDIFEIQRGKFKKVKRNFKKVKKAFLKDLKEAAYHVMGRTTFINCISN